MRSVKSISIAASAAALACVALASPAPAQILVVHATGSAAQRYEVGSLLPDARPIRLGPSDSLELLSSAGTWTWDGPGEFPRAAGEGRSAPPAGPGTRRPRVGAVRSVGGTPAARPNVWMVDVVEPGAVCVPGSTPPLLWRMQADTAATTTVTAPGGEVGTVTWAAGQAAAPWPEGIPLVDGGAYRLTGDTNATPVEIVVRQLSEPPTSLTAAGTTLLQRDCAAQMDVLLGQVQTLDESAGS